MDTSEQYIKMCDHPKVQDLEPNEYPKNIGNWYWIVQRDRKCVACNIFQDGNYCRYCRRKIIEVKSGYVSCCDGTDEEHVWLPRQDQLQDMVADNYTAWGLSNKFSHWLNRESNSIYKPLTITYKFSMEQLWLAFVIHELHKLKWDGEKWRKQ